MFFYKTLTHTINLHPSFFGARTEEFVKAKLYSDVEGTIDGRVGFIICCLQVLDGDTVGKVLPGTGEAEFHLTYRALILKVFKDEVLDAKVTRVAPTGFFATVGPLEIFVSSFYIPNDLEYTPTANPPAYTSRSLGETIKQDDHVRLKIVGTRQDQNNLFAIGSIKGDYLGLIH